MTGDWIPWASQGFCHTSEVTSRTGVGWGGGWGGGMATTQEEVQGGSGLEEHGLSEPHNAGTARRRRVGRPWGFESPQPGRELCSLAFPAECCAAIACSLSFTCSTNCRQFGS